MTPSTSTGFSVLTLNLRFGLADDGLNCWENRKKSLPALFNAYRPDFIALQEANDFQVDYLAGILTGYDAIGQRKPAPANWQSNVIFFQRRWVPTFFRHFYLSTTPSVPSKLSGSRWPRQCTMGMFADNDRQLICIDTHLDFAESVQVQSAEIIFSQLSCLPADVPALLMGDFNATPQSACYQRFTGEAAAAGFRFQNAAARPFPGTYHGFEGRTDGEHIDWILYRGAVTPLLYRVVRDRFNGVYPSDHYPVYAEFTEH